MNATESTQSRQKQDDGIAEERKQCLLRHGIESLFNTTLPTQNQTNGLMCPPYFDGMMCWPPTKANSLSIRECPLYVIGIVNNGNATRFCTDNGYWYKHEEYKTYWTNYSLCYTQDSATIVEDLPIINVTLIPYYLPFIKRISLTGYAISLCTLLVAFMIMFSIKKLHCPRNKLHMHLFASFILRAGLSLVKDFSFIEGVGLASDVTNKNGKSYFYVDIESNNWQCKFLTSLWEYFITANYSWILMEGLYLHNLIFRALFTDPSKNITYYVTLGWGLPASVILVWILFRIEADDTLCWTTHTSVSFMIIRIPTMISVLINMALFLRIAAVIFSKLQAPIYEVAQRYRKWARSTLVLVPLFGIHYGLFIGMSFYIGISEIVELVWLIGDQIFASFQGFFVAVLYCFLNGEVRAELKPHIRNILVYLATNSYFQVCFPCRDRYLRSARGRTSVCTTMSCSSLYNNGISHPRNSRSRWDVNHSKLSINHLDRNRDHVYRPNSHVRSLQDMSVRYNVAKRSPNGEISKFPLSNYSSNGNITAETSLCIQDDSKSKSEPHLKEEESAMLSKSHP